ncbi:UNVERIFIED_CONTAM: Cold-regulated protein 27 [Sesamum calycinum]|uniref:Cold-regulated protein 27 n=1 Tax=Sesamum calycinum TaxID=2727403 RepID=A0AAW2QM96_9LAMI
MEDSVDSYGVGARNCHDEQEETSSLVQAPAAETEEWTDEKHSLYLKSMEATFVNQLYKSLDLFGRQSEKNGISGSKSSKPKQTSIRAPSGQFKVLRDGCWSKLDFKRDGEEVNQEEESGVLLANPWIQHYSRSEKQDNRTFPASCSKAPLATTVNRCSAQNFQLWRQDSVGSNTEVTDQNFNDDDLEEEENCRRIHEIKRRKTSTDTIQSNDQVVPFGNILRANDVEADDNYNQIRCLSSVSGSSAFSSSDKLVGGDYRNYYGNSLSTSEVVFQKRGFLGCVDGEVGNMLSKVYEERRVLGYSPEQLFNVVAAVDMYQEFLPCARAYFHTSIAGLVPANADSHINLQIETTSSQSTLFDHLINAWEFNPGPVPGTCNLYFLVDFKFKSPLYRQIANMFFKEVVSRLVGSFCDRCQLIYGPAVPVLENSYDQRA